MEWIELIVVRAVDTRHRRTIMRLVDQLLSDRRPKGLKAAALYRNAFVETDMGIHLTWSRRVERPAKSDIGLELAAALEEYGRIHHTLWIGDEMDISDEMGTRI